MDNGQQISDKAAMPIPNFMQETLAQAKARPLWGVAFAATLLLPLMLIVARAGIEICACIIGLSFLWTSLRTKQWRWLRAPFTLACMVAWAWMLLVVTPLALTPNDGLITALAWFRFPLMFAALRYWVLVDWQARSTLSILLGALLALVALDCFVQYYTGMSLSGHGILAQHRLSGPFAGPKVGIYLALITVPVVALALMAGLRVPCWRSLVGSLLLLVVMIVAVMYSGERAAFLGIVAASLIALMLVMFSEKRLRLAGGCAVAAILALMALLYSFNPSLQVRAWQMVYVMSHYSQSPYGQLAGVGMRIGEAHLPHGVGLRGFRNLCPILTYTDPQSGVSVPYHGVHPHNYYSEWFAETGLPGLLLFSGMVGCLLWEALRQVRHTRGLATIAPAVAIGMLVQHFFPLMSSQSFFVNWGAMLQWYAISLIFAALPRNDRPATP